jgi:hypothetical protein
MDDEFRQQLLERLKAIEQRKPKTDPYLNFRRRPPDHHGDEGSRNGAA